MALGNINGKVKGERGKLRVSESRGKVHFYSAEREQVQSHGVRLKRKAEVYDRGLDNAGSISSSEVSR